MNKFMGGLTLGIIATACFFIFYNPLQKNAAVPETPVVIKASDSFPVQDTITRHDTAIRQGGALIQNNDGISRDSLVLFARSLLGTPYLYGSADPVKGFDCSGFITYVFNHFKFAVPRSSGDFEHIGKKRALDDCRPGDVILFTGTDPGEQTIGHIGIVCDITNVNPSFIHSTSGKAYGVTISSMDNKYYQERFIAVIDLLFR